MQDICKCMLVSESSFPIHIFFKEMSLTIHMRRQNALIYSGWLILSILLMTCVAYAHDLVWPGEKLKVLYPQADSFEQKNLYVSDEQKAALERKLDGRLPEEDLKPSIYFAVVKPGPDARPRKAAAIMFVDAYGEGGKIEIGIVVSGKGELMKIHLFENKEPAIINTPAFLKQFESRKASDFFKVGSDITAPRGVEKSAQAIASGARRGLLIIDELFRKK